MTKQTILLHQKVSSKAKQCLKPNTPKTISSIPTFAPSHLGNAAIQRLLAQRSGGDGAFDLDEQTASRINSARGGGQALDGAVQTQMIQSMGTDFSGVRVHTSSESHALNEQLSAKAFTTGNDIFFRGGEYNPQSSGGQELIAHELTHVVQQSSGAVGGGGGAMRVNAPGDHFEQEADSVAKSVTSTPVPAAAVQRVGEEQEEPIQTKRLQRQEEEEVQAKRIQRQENDEELQMKRIQRQEEEEAVQMQAEDEEAVQKAPLPDEEPEAAA